MKFTWACGHSFEWDEAEKFYHQALADCGDYCDFTLDKDGVHDSKPCSDCMEYPKEVTFETDMELGPKYPHNRN